ncbi:hypothetical protein [Helicobacter pylori]|uniref:hypothetical protein n=1 Tax=Helicobacter pylori TaxID=210 RepID=UPI001C5827B6|nr:hypothetical protein [Helicobacter pylori]
MRIFSFNTNAFFADINHQTNSSFSVIAIIYCNLYPNSAKNSVLFRAQERIAVRLYSS